MPALTVAVMSYNRADYLRNCLESVRRHLPDSPILVVDDGSDDPDQIGVLKWAQADLGASVLSGDTTENWHGGLYNNMQRALEVCGTPLLLYLQDDTQIVRDGDPQQIRTVAEHFAQTGAAFAYPFFLKQKKRFHWARRFDSDTRHRLLLPKRDGSGSAWLSYSDICIADVARLRAAGWRFKPSEPENERAARDAFPVGMAVLADPWGFYCPEVPVFRHRVRETSLVHRLTTRGRQGANAFVPMREDATARLCQRQPLTLPIAEEWLETRDPDIRKPFVFNELKRSRLIWLAHSLEMRLRRR